MSACASCKTLATAADLSLNPTECRNHLVLIELCASSSALILCLPVYLLQPRGPTLAAAVAAHRQRTHTQTEYAMSFMRGTGVFLC